MLKIHKNKIKRVTFISLQVLAILALFIGELLPANAYALRYCYMGGRSCYEVVDVLPDTGDNETSRNFTPVIYSISPNYGSSVNGNLTVYVDGRNFVQESLVKWNNNYRTTTFNGSNQLAFTLTPSDSEVLGNHIVTVFTPGPGGGNSNAVYFNVTNNIPYVIPSGNVLGASTVRVTPKKVAVSKPAITTATATPCLSTGNNTSTGSATGSESYGTLTANALFGSPSFLPSGLVQWLVLLILILLVVILTRKIFTRDQRDTPLKHA